MAGDILHADVRRRRAALFSFAVLECRSFQISYRPAFSQAGKIVSTDLFGKVFLSRRSLQRFVAAPDLRWLLRDF